MSKGTPKIAGSQDSQFGNKNKVIDLAGGLLTSWDNFLAVVIFDTEGGFLVNPRLYGPSRVISDFMRIVNEPMDSLTYDLVQGEHLFAKSYKTKKYVITDDLLCCLANPESLHGKSVHKAFIRMAKIFGFREFLSFPVFYDETLYAMIMVGKKKVKFTKSDINFIKKVSDLFLENLVAIELVDGLKKKCKAVRKLFVFSQRVVDLKPGKKKSDSKEMEDILTSLSEVEDLGNNSVVVRDSGVEVDFSTGEIYHDGKRVQETLSVAELDLLKFMVENNFKVTTRENIGRILWKEDYGAKYSDWAISQAISRIRKKLRDKPPYCHLITLKGRGFMLRGVKKLQH
ncbi:winged helix-turn-helix domain-containing protein [Candidatus Dojkabacteria bacterium]|nr:winged helix-turn-helix domain-containing protein [Candidatus Dojkabacteria bacterium]